MLAATAACRLLSMIGATPSDRFINTLGGRIGTLIIKHTKYRV
jgi:hypothetical protein